MKKNKYGILVLVLLLCIAMTAVMAGCKGEQEAPAPGNSGELSQYVELDKSQITLDKFNDYTLQCTVVGISEELKWTSSDDVVATVENGKVVALGVGEAEITASAGAYSAKCVVKVQDQGVVPAFAPYAHDFEIKRTNTYDVSPAIMFAGDQKNLVDAQLTYQVVDSEIATIDANGIATALKEGVTEFTVSGSFRGVKMMSVTGTIVVKKNITIALNSLNVTVYACDPDGTYATQCQLEAAVYVEGALQKDAQLVWSSENEEKVTVENGLVTGLRAGQVMVNAAYTAADGEVINAGVVVNVSRPVIQLEDLQEFDLSNKAGSSTMELGDLASYVEGLFTGFYDITDQERQQIDGASYNGKLSLPNKGFTKHGFRRYALESELVSIEFDGLAITKKIFTINDLVSICTSANTLDGYYRLEADIDAHGKTVKLVGSWTNSSNKGFIGTFEGNGHTISNVNTSNVGIFYCIGTATIRNLGLANVSGTRVMATEVHGATIENVVISSKTADAVFNYVGSRTKISNLIAVMDKGKHVINTFGSASDAENLAQNFLVVAGNANSNNGWSGTQVPGVFYNYYKKDDPAAMNDLKVYGSKEEMIIDLRDNGGLAAFDFGVHLEGSKLYYNDALICQYEIDVTAPASVHRGTTCQVQALDSTFSLLQAVDGIHINSETGVVNVAADVPEFTEFTVVVQHKEYKDVSAQVTIRVTIDYKPVDTDVSVRYDLSTGAAAYSLTISDFTDTFKRIGWEGTDGSAEGVTAQNGSFTLSAGAVKALGAGDGRLAIYTEEENVFYVDAIIADKFIYTYADLAALYQPKNLTGYYLLANDIEANNTTALTLIGTWTNKSNEGFLATFNGDGHTISNLKVGSAGLFGYVGGTGVIKNLALVNVSGSTNAVANEAHGMTAENLFVSSSNIIRGFTWVGDSSLKNVMMVLPKGQHYINTNGSAAVRNTHKNVYVVAGDPTTNNGWSGTKVLGLFHNYYVFDDPNTKYNLKHYYNETDLLVALEKNNTLTAWEGSSFTFEGGAVLFGGNMVITPEVIVSGPDYAYRGQTTKLKSSNAVFSIKEAVEGITVAEDGTITVAADVAEGTAFTVVATHSGYSQFTKEILMTVAIDYNEIDQTHIPVEFDLSTNSSRYRYSIPDFKGTYKAIGWEGEGFTNASGVSIRNGELTMTKIAMAAIGSGSGTLCVYTQEEDVYLLNVTIADMFIDTLDELKTLATGAKVSGYYVLNADIDCGGEKVVLSAYTSTADNGFVGTFDGRGHIISNVNVGNNGFIWGIGAGTVKNLALVNVTGTGAAFSTETHEATVENVYISSDTCPKAFTYVGDSTFNNIIVVLPNGQHAFQTFGAANVNNTISNVYAVIANPVTNSGWSGTKVTGLFNDYYKSNDPKSLYNLRHFTTVTELMDAMVNGNALSSITGSFGVTDSCLTFGGKQMLVPFSIVGPEEAPRGTSIALQAPSATFALKEAVAGVTVNATSGKVTLEPDMTPGTTFTVTAISSKFPGFTTEKTLTVVVNWKQVDWTDKGSLQDMGKGAAAAITLPEAISGELVQIACGDTAFTDGFSYADGVVTLDASLVDAMYDQLGYGDHTLMLRTDSENSYVIQVTMFTKIITSYEDLVSIKANQVNGMLDGYYILANDIDATGKAPICLIDFNDHINNKTNSHVGFYGIFDGRGHTITGLTVKNGAYAKIGGLFGQILNGAVVRNVAFVDMSTDGTTVQQYLLTGESCRMTGLIENVVVSAKDNAGWVFCMVGCDPNNTETPGVGTIRNMVVTGVNYFTFGFMNNPQVENVLVAANKGVMDGPIAGVGNETARDKVTVYDSTEALLNALATNNVLKNWNSSISYSGGKLYFNGKEIA